VKALGFLCPTLTLPKGKGIFGSEKGILFLQHNMPKQWASPSLWEGFRKGYFISTSSKSNIKSCPANG
jgi:hypothetical protein